MSKREPNSVRVLVRMPVFRRMWAAVTVSSLGDWLGLLATTSMAAYLTQDSSNLVQGAAVSGVLVTRLLPDLLLAPVAGALVDRFDRRKVAIVCDVAAAVLYLSIIVGGTLTWLLIAQFLVEAVGLFGTPAKQALWVNIVPREKLAVANQLNYVSVYGMVPVAALLFALLSTISQFFGAPVDPATTSSALISGASRAAIDIAIVIDALTYLFSAGTIYLSRRMIPAFVGERAVGRSIFSLVREGLSFLTTSRIMRAIYIGILGAFGAGGLVAGVAQAYVATLGAGNAGYGILFGTVFTGLALGMLLGPKFLPTVPRRMVFTLSIGLAGVALVIMGLLQDFLGAVLTSAVMGLFAGIAWITGFTMIGQEVADQLRGRIFAFVMSSVRLVLLGTIAVGPILAGALGSHLVSVGNFQMYLSGPAIVLSVGGLIAVLVSLYAGRQVGGMRGGVLRRLFGRRRDNLIEDDDRPGVLIAVEGADTDAVDRYAAAVSQYLSAGGWLVGDHNTASALAEPPRIQIAPGRSVDAPSAALRGVADLADLATDRLRPALDAGAVVVCHGYVDALVVRFGAEGGLDEGRILRLATWATGGLRADLTVLVDVDPPAMFGSRVPPADLAHGSGAETGIGGDPSPDTEGDTAEPVDPVQVYRDLAASAPERYLVVRPLPADQDVLSGEVTGRIDSTLRERLPAKAAVSTA